VISAGRRLRSLYSACNALRDTHVTLLDARHALPLLSCEIWPQRSVQSQRFVIANAGSWLLRSLTRMTLVGLIAAS